MVRLTPQPQPGLRVVTLQINDRLKMDFLPCCDHSAVWSISLYLFYLSLSRSLSLSLPLSLIPTPPPPHIQRNIYANIFGHCHYGLFNRDFIRDLLGFRERGRVAMATPGAP